MRSSGPPPYGVKFRGARSLLSGGEVPSGLLYLQSGDVHVDFSLLESLRGVIHVAIGYEGETKDAVASIPQLLSWDLHLDDLSELAHGVSNVVLSDVTDEASQLYGVGIYLGNRLLLLLLLPLSLLEFLEVEGLLLGGSWSCTEGVQQVLGLLLLLLLKCLQLLLQLSDILVSCVLHLGELFVSNLILEVFLFHLSFVVGMPHIFSLNRSQVHILSQIIFSRANTKGLHLLSFEESLGDSSLDEEGSDFDGLLDLLVTLELDLVDDVLVLLQLSGLVFQVVCPGGEDSAAHLVGRIAHI